MGKFYFNDMERVLRGLNIVVKEANRHNIKSVFSKFDRMQYHASELFNLFYDILSSNNTTSTIKNDTPNSNIKNESSNSTYSTPTSIKVSNSVSNIVSDVERESNVTTTISKTITTPDVNVATSSSISSNPSSNDNDLKSINSTVAANVSKIKDSNSIRTSKNMADDVEMSSSQTNLQSSYKKFKMKEKSVPSTQIERVIGFGSLAAGLMFGRVKESATSVLYGKDSSDDSRSSGISEENANRLADSLSRMRGAALNLQDEDYMPSTLSKALNRVRQGADYMPIYQLEKQMQQVYGQDWRATIFESFDDVPIAAASIGQVHKATLRKTNDSSMANNNTVAVAVKVQYPGVAQSIQSDLQNLKTLITLMNVLPKGLFIDQIIKVANDELSVECDYEAEAQHQIRYRELVSQDKLLSHHVSVPNVYTNLTRKQVIVSEFIEDTIPIDQTMNLSLTIRNQIARHILILTIKELFEWKFIQSDPNFSNFLYCVSSNTLHCIDFGAAREYTDEFIDDYIELVWAAANNDRDTIIKISIKMGFLSGDESTEMTNAHVQAGMIFGEPFRTNDVYDFSNSAIVARAASHGDTFLKQRLKAPPKETYSLHRKLAGAFLLCIRLKAVIPCRDILEEVYKSYHNKKNKSMHISQ